MNPFREAVILEARSWIGTPYRHQASKKGEGCDCLGLIRGIYEQFIGDVPEIPAYSPDWADFKENDLLTDGFNEYLVPRPNEPLGTLDPATILVFRMGLGTPVKHAAILTDRETIIHGYWGRTVCETRLVPWWKRRIAGAYDFLEV